MQKTYIKLGYMFLNIFSLLVVIILLILTGPIEITGII